MPRLNVPAVQSSPAIFADPASRAVQELLDRLAPTDATLLIIGETGTGKEMAARYVHERSNRRSGPFLAVNCGALSDSLAEAELFGHAKGAFTGAIRDQPGWFEAADGGTLLLDEIGDLPLHLQVKLLRVLQEREVTRVGSRQPLRINVRVIAATNIDLSTAIAEKQFREDLYFRLNVATVILPPLRERRECLPTLAHHFLKIYSDRLGRPQLQLSVDALALLERYSWPGNIRELENVIHNAVLLTEGTVITRENLQITGSADLPPASLQSPETMLRLLFETQIRNRTPDLFAQVTRCLVQTAFDLADSNQVHAAQSLGLSRNALRTQLAHLGIIAPRRRPDPAPDSRLAGPARRRLRLGYQKFGTLSIIKARQSLERRLGPAGIAIDWVPFPAGPQLLAALTAGLVDFGTTGEVPPIFAQAGGGPILYIAHEPPAPQALAIVVRPDSPYRSMAELKGKRIQLNHASNVHYLLVRGLEAHGMALEDIEPVYIEPQDLPSQGVAEDVAAWALWDPLLTMALRRNDVRVLLDGSGLVSNHYFHIARRELAETSPEIIHLLVDELRMIGQELISQPGPLARAVSTSLGIDVPALELAFARLAHGTRPLDQSVIWEQQKIADRFYALGLIPRAISVRTAVWSDAA